MREIKFRAFYDGGIYDVTEIMWSDETAYLVDPKDSEEGQTVEFNHIELMQFTGLKDKSGKPIYEGDIVEDDATPMRYRDIVEMKRGRWMPDSMFITGAKFEVTGNIYENPELLK